MNLDKIIARDNIHLKNLIYESINKDGYACDLNHIDVTNVIDMSNLFTRSPFTGDISKWNTENVINMYGLFSYCHFNGDISQWNTSNVKDMKCMFQNSKFNGDLSNWNVSNVQNMNSMFYSSPFNNSLDKWNTKNVTDMSNMFAFSPFNKDISKWDVSKLECAMTMFYQSKFNGDLSNWNVQNLMYMDAMFHESDFDGDLSKWKINNVQSLNNLFLKNLNIDLSINTTCSVDHDFENITHRLPKFLESILDRVFDNNSDIENYLKKYKKMEFSIFHVQRSLALSKKPMYVKKNDFDFVKSQQLICNDLGVTIKDMPHIIYQLWQNQNHKYIELPCMDFNLTQ